MHTSSLEAGTPLGVQSPGVAHEALVVAVQLLVQPAALAACGNAAMVPNPTSAPVSPSATIPLNRLDLTMAKPPVNQRESRTPSGSSGGTIPPKCGACSCDGSGTADVPLARRCSSEKSAIGGNHRLLNPACTPRPSARCEQRVRHCSLNASTPNPIRGSSSSLTSVAATAMTEEKSSPRGSQCRWRHSQGAAPRATCEGTQRSDRDLRRLRDLGRPRSRPSNCPSKSA